MPSDTYRVQHAQTMRAVTIVQGTLLDVITWTEANGYDVTAVNFRRVYVQVRAAAPRRA